MDKVNGTSRNLSDKNLSLVQKLRHRCTNPNPRNIFPEKNLTDSNLLESPISALINAQNRENRPKK